MIQIVYGDVELRPVIGQPGGFVRAFHGGYVDEVRDIAHRGDQAIAGERLRINHQNPKALKRRIRRIGAAGPDRKRTRLNSSQKGDSRTPASAGKNKYPLLLET